MADTIEKSTDLESALRALFPTIKGIKDAGFLSKPEEGATDSIVPLEGDGNKFLGFKPRFIPEHGTVWIAFEGEDLYYAIF